MPEFPLTSTDNTAVIVGAHGQDGFYLNKSLQKNGVKTALICRRYVELPGKFKRNKFSILDPEAVDAQACADQRAMVERCGGEEAVRAKGAFDHSPTPGEQPAFRTHP